MAKLSIHFYRSIEFDRSKINVEDRSVPVSFSSEHPVDRGDYDEVLDHSADGMDMSRLNDSAAVLVNHDVDDHVGVVEKPELSSDEKKGRALIRFGKSDRATEIFNDIKDGIRKHMSVGYERLRIMSSEAKEQGRRCVRFAWRPFELSIVTVPADPTVGVGRSAPASVGGQTRNLTNMGCAGLCHDALSDCNQALGAIEACEGEAVGPHEAAEEAIRDAIAALAITIEDLNFWSEATAAETVVVCAECATYCDAAIVAMRSIAGCPSCSAACAEAIEELTEACEACRGNAGIEAQAESGSGANSAVEEDEEDDETDQSALNSEGETGGTTVDTRAKPNANHAPIANMSTPANPTTPAATTPAATAPSGTDIQVLRNQATEEERTRVKNIRATTKTITEKHPDGAEQFRSLSDTAIEQGQSAIDFNVSLLAAIPGVRKNPVMTAESIGMSPRDVTRYSLVRAIQSVLQTGRSVPEGLEGEVHTAMVKRVKESGTAVSASGFWVPPWTEMSAPQRGRRDLNVTTGSQGGAFVQTTIFTPIIEILRNRMVTQRLGVQSMAGLEGNIAIPRQTGAATAYSLPESATLTKSTQAIDQILLAPHRVGAYNEYSKQLLLQSSVDVENFIRDDLMKVLAIKWDKLILEGSGQGSDPTGILNTEAIGSVTFGGAPTWAKVVSFETALALANADIGTMAYVTTPGVRGTWKVTPKVSTTAFPIFIWEKGDWGDGSNDGDVNDYRAACTNQISNDAVAFGHWADAIHALWGGYDVVVNPYSRDIDAVVRITVNTFGDVAVQHAASFAWSSDSGKQA